MKKRNFYQLICLLLILAVFGSCRKDDNNFKVNFSNPQAFLLKKRGNSKSDSSDKTTLFQVDANGNITPLIEGITVEEAIPFSNGIIIRLSNGNRYIIYLDNTYWKLEDFWAEFVGETEDGDLLFSDVSIIRKGAQTISKLQTSLSSPYVRYLSGNFAIIESNNLYQIFNTVNNQRYNVNVNTVVALNKEKALISDTDGMVVINMNTGIRSPADIRCTSGENVYLKNGAAILSSCVDPPTGYVGYAIGIVDTLGQVEVLCNDGFNISEMNAYPSEKNNSVLFHSGDYFVIKELNKISVVKRGNLNKTEILSGYNITKIALKSDKVYFIAEDVYGEKMVGFFHLEQQVVMIFVTEDEYENIFTI